MRRGIVTATGAVTAALALYSCSMHAAITTDDSGHVVDVAALRIEASLRQVALAMLVAGGQIAFELRLPRTWLTGGCTEPEPRPRA